MGACSTWPSVVESLCLHAILDKVADSMTHLSDTTNAALDRLQKELRTSEEKRTYAVTEADKLHRKLASIEDLFKDVQSQFKLLQENSPDMACSTTAC